MTKFVVGNFYCYNIYWINRTIFEYFGLDLNCPDNIHLAAIQIIVSRPGQYLDFPGNICQDSVWTTCQTIFICDRSVRSPPRYGRYLLQKPIRIIVHGRVANFFVKKIFTSFEKLFVADQLRWLRDGVGRVGREQEEICCKYQDICKKIWQLLSIKENICPDRHRKSHALQDAKKYFFL